jgi:DNA-binding LytR/AlgR family response regulator
MEILLFNTRDELLRVSLKHVVYFEADGNYTHIYFSNGAKATLLYSLSHMEHLIDEKLKGKVQPFIRIGKKYIVNSSCVFQINTLKQKLILTNFDTPQLYTLAVSKEALKSLKELYTKKK